MSDDNQQPDPAQFMITIAFNARTDAMEINGPLDQLVLCYGILERAKDIVRAHAAKKQREQLQITRPSVVLPPEFRGNRR